MPDYSDFDPAKLKPSLVDGEGNLKPSLTTDSYSGGVPTSAGDLKPSLVNADGSLKAGLLNGSELKAGLIRRFGIDDPKGWARGAKGAYATTADPPIVTVVSLKDSGSGSLRAALTGSGPRVVRFHKSLSGYRINLLSQITISNPYLTFFGGDAVVEISSRTQSGPTIVIGADEVVFRHIRIRPGNVAHDNGDPLQIDDADNVYIQNCSFSLSTDENVQSTINTGRLTIDRCIISAPFANDSRGPLFRGGGNGVVGFGPQATLTRTLVSHSDYRNPKIGITSEVEIINNWFYDNLDHIQIQTGTATSRVNVLGNYVRRGPNSPESIASFIERAPDSLGDAANGEFYRSGNVIDGTITPVSSDEGALTEVFVPFAGDTSFEAADAALRSSIASNVGARPLDSADARLIANAESANVTESPESIDQFYFPRFGVMKGSGDYLTAPNIVPDNATDFVFRGLFETDDPAYIIALDNSYSARLLPTSGYFQVSITDGTDTQTSTVERNFADGNVHSFEVTLSATTPVTITIVMDENFGEGSAESTLDTGSINTINTPAGDVELGSLPSDRDDDIFLADLAILQDGVEQDAWSFNKKLGTAKYNGGSVNYSLSPETDAPDESSDPIFEFDLSSAPTIITPDRSGFEAINPFRGTGSDSGYSMSFSNGGPSVGTMNGLNVATFDGSTKQIQTAATPTLSGDFTVVFVCRRATTGVGAVIGSGSNEWFGFHSDAANFRLRWDSVSHTIPGATQGSEPMFVALVRSSGVFYVYRDGQQEGSVTPTNPTKTWQPRVWGGRTFGVAAQPFSGDLAQFGIYDRALPLEEIEDLASDFEEKWGSLAV